jgi:hypothetical protein
MVIRRILNRFPFNVRRRLRDVESRLYDLTNLERAFDRIVTSPRYVSGDGFNDQAGRRRLFADLKQAIRFDAIIETGTYFGDTSGYMHEMTGLPVYTCEVNRHFHAVAQKRLEHFPNIHVVWSDSRRFLASLPQQVTSDRTVFCYLDAHWGDDLPLLGEIDLIARNWQRFVVMIDDFQVPGDAGYIYDLYGKGKDLILQTILPTVQAHHLTVYAPSLPSSQETSILRGCAVLAPPSLAETLAHLASLRLILPASPLP